MKSKRIFSWALGPAGVLLMGLLAPFPAMSESEVHWGYEGNTGPAYWSRLTWDYAICEQGVHQSPIDLADASEVALLDLERFIGVVDYDLDHKAQVMNVLDNGHTIQVTSDASLGISVDGDDYGLLQFHFHSPSEHTVDGRQFPLEAHFVMGSEDGDLAVISYLFEEGEHYAAYDAIVAALPKAPGDTRRLENVSLDLEELKPLAGAFYAYPGSLTTPPCSEGVRWLVTAEPQQMSAQQLAAFAAVLKGNARPVQPRHIRQLVLVKPESP